MLFQKKTLKFATGTQLIFQDTHWMMQKKEPDKAVSAALVFIQQRYDLIGFLSDFEAFVEKLRDNVNLKHSYDGEKRNVTHGALNKPVITPEEVRAIKDSNQMDISLYQKLKESVRT
jgi:hypothetical protein